MKVKVNARTSYIAVKGQPFKISEDKIIDAPFDSIRELVSKGDATYAEQVPYNPASKNKLLFEGANASGNGFGYALQETLVALNKVCEVYSTQPSGDGDIHPEVLEIGSRYLETPDCVGIIFDTHSVLRSKLPTEIAGIYTTFETTRLNPLSVENINSFDFCIATSEFAKKCFIDSGVIVPIYVAPHGVRSDIFSFNERQDKDTFTFGHWGSLTKRKGTDVAVIAFERAFPTAKYPNVKLQIHTVMSRGGRPFWDIFPYDERISTTYGFIPKKTLIDRMYNWDALVFPHRGEGFGLPIIESMATGLPVITTGWSAPTEFIKDKETGLLASYKLVEADWYDADPLGRDQRGILGLGAEPDVDHIVQLMRWVYENREDARKIGRAAARDVAKNWTWDRSAKAIIKAKDHFLKHNFKLKLYEDN